MKISNKQHITKKGQIKKNPSKYKIQIKLVAVRDWKDTYTSAEFNRASNVAKKINGKIADLPSPYTDDNFLFVIKGISSSELEYLLDSYGPAFLDGEFKANSKTELKEKLKKASDNYL